MFYIWQMKLVKPCSERPTQLNSTQLVEVESDRALWTLLTTRLNSTKLVSEFFSSSEHFQFSWGESSCQSVQSARLNSTELNQFWKCSELCNWAKNWATFSYFFSWVVRVFRAPDALWTLLQLNSTQLNSTQLPVKLSLVGCSEQALTLAMVCHDKAWHSTTNIVPYINCYCYYYYYYFFFTLGCKIPEG